MVLKVRIVTTILRVEGYWKGEQRGHACKAGSLGRGVGWKESEWREARAG